MPAAGVPATLKHVEKADEVGLTIPMGIGERIANPGLGREVNDVWKPVRGKQRRHRAAIGDIKLLELEALQAFELRQSCLLEPNVVIAVQVVETDHRSTLFEQTTCDMEPDEAGGARHQNRFTINHGTHDAGIGRPIGTARDRPSIADRREPGSGGDRLS